MNIGMVLTNSGYPPDIRVEKEAKSLMAAGHRVHLLCEFSKRGTEKALEDVDGVHVQRVRVSDKLYSLTAKVRYYREGIYEPWLVAIHDFARQNSIDVLHVHDLPHALTCGAAARAIGIPWVFDMHGDGPAAVEIHRAANPVKLSPMLALKRTVLSLLVGNDVKWLRRMEKRALKQADHVVVVVDESKERLVKLGTPEDKVTVVMNCEEVESFLSIPLDANLMEEHAERFIVSYVGGMEAVRGLDILIDSFRHVVARMPNATLLLVGDGYMRSRLEEQANRLGMQGNIVFTGWVNFSLVPTYMAMSQVCAVPHSNNALTDTTIPHKLFQCMLLGKPVVALPVRPIKRILDETGAGIVARDESPEALADAILQAAKPEAAHRMGENGKSAATGKYSWANEGRKLVAMYSKLSQHARHTGQQVFSDKA